MLEALRNRALLYALASSGGRISEVLRLPAKDVRGAQDLESQGSAWQDTIRNVRVHTGFDGRPNRSV